MPTQNSINTDIPIEVSKGGTEQVAHTAYSVLAGGATTTSPIESVGTGTSTYAITSAGAGASPVIKNLPTFFELLAADPGAPADDNGVTVTFTVT